LGLNAVGLEMETEGDVGALDWLDSEEGVSRVEVDDEEELDVSAVTIEFTEVAD
jgi:hypothetical protein